MKSKTKIEKQMKRKRNPELIRSIIKAKKLEGWLEVAGILASPKKIGVNLDEIDKNSEEADTIVVPGKVLGGGEINKKIRIAALNFSEQARKKLKDKNCEIISILEEIKVNPKGEGIKIIK